MEKVMIKMVSENGFEYLPNANKKEVFDKCGRMEDFMEMLCWRMGHNDSYISIETIKSDLKDLHLL